MNARPFLIRLGCAAFLILAFALLPARFALAEEPSPLLILGEDFQFTGRDGVRYLGAIPKEGEGYVEASGDGNADLVTMVEVPADQTYDIFTRSYDYSDKNPGQHRYLVLIDGKPVAASSGALLRKRGSGWEKVDTLFLSAGKHLLSLRKVTSFGRNGAILLAPPGSFSVETKDEKNNPQLTSQRLGRIVSVFDQLGKYRLRPTPIPVSKPIPSEPDITKLPTIAQLENASARVLFKQTDKPGEAPQVYRELYLAKDGQWTAVPFNSEAERVFLIYAPDTRIRTDSFIPSWTRSSPMEIMFQGAKYLVADEINPFAAGATKHFTPTTVRQIGPDQVEVDYLAKDGTTIKGIWSLQGKFQKLSLTLSARATGNYSLGLSAYQPWSRDDVSAVQLAPLFQKQRLPSVPTLLASASTPHAMALVEIKRGQAQPSIYAVAADPANMPFQWHNRDNSPYGFSLLNEACQVQPTVFSPILGFPDSKRKAGDEIHAGFITFAQPGDWQQGLETASDELFKVTDYRDPIFTSLTGAALNMVDLIDNEDASGWQPRLKGSYNIESAQTVTQASPLTYLSVALLTRDETFYVRRALPTLEFTLSRNGPHFAAAKPVGDDESYVEKNATLLQYPGLAYGATYWQGVYDLTQGLNPWLKELAYDGAKARGSFSRNVIPAWTEEIGTYRLDPTPKKLAALQASCDRWLQDDMYAKRTQPLGITPFYNFISYPYWWPLLDLYELTGNKKYLDAAQEGAFYTLEGLWSHPSVPAGTAIANQGGQFQGYDVLFWKGDTKTRLGVPRQPGDTPERVVPAWWMAPTGLGIEQPYTYYIGKLGLRHILNSAWAPSLLRLNLLTGREIYKTYARNSIIGRFSNYPGYYVLGFTDTMLRPEYPLKGPDVTDIYYHHIPAHLAFTLDYLFMEAEQMSGGKVVFPWDRQQGYVWFTNREFGAQPGRVYADEGLRPWLSRTAFSVDASAVNYFAATRPGLFDVVLTNSSHAPVQSSLKLDLAKAGVSKGSPYQYLVDGKPAGAGHADIENPFVLPAGSVGVMRFASQLSPAFPDARPLEAKPLHFPLPGGGILHALRIRSPFGKDSLYVFIEGSIPPGTEVRLTLEGLPDPVKPLSSPPYEFSVYPIAMDLDAKLEVTVLHPHSAAPDKVSVLLPGTVASPSHP